jgi:uncharacterized membrane protein (DUF485 family)
MNLQELEQKRDAHTTRIFLIMLEMVFIFAIPAIAAVYFGKKLSAINSTLNWSAIFLLVAFVISWTVVAWQYRKQTRILNDLTAQIKKAREEETK